MPPLRPSTNTSLSLRYVRYLAADQPAWPEVGPLCPPGRLPDRRVRPSSWATVTGLALAGFLALPTLSPGEGSSADRSVLRLSSVAVPTATCTRTAHVYVFSYGGQLKWSKTLPAPKGDDTAPALAGTSTLFTTESDRVAAFSRQDGHLRWVVRLAGPIANAWLVGDKVVAEVHNSAISWDLVGLSALTGQRLWWWHPDQSILGSPVPTGQGDLAIAFGPAQVHPAVISVATGKLLWGHAQAEGSDVSLGVDGDVVLWRSGTTLTAYNDLTGAQYWSAPAVGETAPVAYGKVVLTTPYTWPDDSYRLTAYALATGKQLWTAAPFAVGATIPTPTGVLAESSQFTGPGKVAMLSLNTGHQKWAASTSGPPNFTSTAWLPAAVSEQGMVSVLESTSHSTLLTWEAASGRLVAEADFPDRPQTLARGAGHAIWATVADQAAPSKGSQPFTTITRLVAGHIVWSQRAEGQAVGPVVPLAGGSGGVQTESPSCTGLGTGAV